jgi:transposase-like protein
MKLEISVPELVEVFKEIQKQPEQIFEMIRLDVREIVGDYMTAMMKAELTHFLGREPYVRSQRDVNHRNGSCDRNFTLKGIGEVGVKVTLGIMDGLPGLETVFKEEFSNAKVQRCTVHVDRNVLAKVPRKLKKNAAADLRSIFYGCFEREGC